MMLIIRLGERVQGHSHKQLDSISGEGEGE